MTACSSGSDVDINGERPGTGTVAHDAGKNTGKGADAHAGSAAGDHDDDGPTPPANDDDAGAAGETGAGDAEGGSDDDAAPEDSASPSGPADAGHAASEAGSTPTADAGPMTTADASTDAGKVTTTDGGKPPPDASTTVDAGSATDASAPADAGSATDASRGPDGSAMDAGHAMDAGPGPDASTGADSPEQTCVDTVNGYRATLGLPALKRWSTEEACTDGEARADYVARKAHSAFGHCSENGQCECPGWSGWSGTPASTIKKCLAAMWAEGPGGGHYDIMSSKSYTMVSCGFYAAPDGTTTSTQDYR